MRGAISGDFVSRERRPIPNRHNAARIFFSSFVITRKIALRCRYEAPVVFALVAAADILVLGAEPRAPGLRRPTFAPTHRLASRIRQAGAGLLPGALLCPAAPDVRH